MSMANDSKIVRKSILNQEVIQSKILIYLSFIIEIKNIQKIQTPQIFTLNVKFY